MKATFVLAAVAAVLAVSVGDARATTIHASNEQYYAGGGTQVSNCQGQGCLGSSFSFGSTTGGILWEVQELVNYEPILNTTTFFYIVGNVDFSSNLTSFHVADTGNLGILSTAPLGWVFLQDLTYWHWTADTSLTPGIPKGSSLPGFSVTLAGIVPVGFKTTFIDLGTSHTDQTGANWMASADPLPEPSSLLLLGSGLAGLALWRRRHSS
jgi:hypothetical protein